MKLLQKDNGYMLELDEREGLMLASFLEFSYRENKGVEAVMRGEMLEEELENAVLIKLLFENCW